MDRMAPGLHDREGILARMRTVAVALGIASWLLLVGIAVLFSSDVVFAWPRNALVFAGGWVVLAGATLRFPRTPGRTAAWIVAGFLSVGACIACANLAWPLTNPTSGGFLEGRGVVNYIFLPWVHLALWFPAAILLGPESS